MNRSIKLFGSFLFATQAYLISHVDTSYAEVKIDPAFQEKMEKYLESDSGREKIGMAIEKYMQEKQVKARQDQENKAKAELETQFKNPVKIDAGKSPIKGPENAKVTIIEFSDFQCPYCSRGRDTVEQVLKAYPNDVKVAFKNLPLPFHNQAMPAAKAALAAHRQGKFWEYHDDLFANQQKLNDSYYLEVAKKLNLDIAKFQNDMKDPAIEAQVKEDMALAEKNGIQGTPGFFVGGVAVKGAYPVDHFKMIIDRLLAAK